MQQNTLYKLPPDAMQPCALCSATSTCRSSHQVLVGTPVHKAPLQLLLANGFRPLHLQARQDAQDAARAEQKKKEDEARQKQEAAAAQQKKAQEERAAQQKREQEERAALQKKEQEEREAARAKADAEAKVGLWIGGHHSSSVLWRVHSCG